MLERGRKQGEDTFQVINSAHMVKKAICIAPGDRRKLSVFYKKKLVHYASVVQSRPLKDDLGGWKANTVKHVLQHLCLHVMP